MSNDFPEAQAFPTESILLYDSILDKNPSFKKWSRHFNFKLALKSGEKLKTLDSLQLVLKKMKLLSFSQTTDLTFIAVGGGSVGDFVGFLASIYLRGRNLIHIPSTWLAAIDSAHGGKNGLNLFIEKNQLGTFFPAQRIYIVKKLLINQPQARFKEALGEAVKIAVINDVQSFKKIEKMSHQMSSEDLYKMLPRLIQNKYKVFSLDPYEKKGTRRLLNLGHTMGHVFESYYGWPHGLCVMLGILFSIRWSYHQKLASEETYIRISNLIEEIWPDQKLSEDLSGISLKQIEMKLAKDKKKISAEHIDFIFIQKIGSTLRQKVTSQQILQEVKRQINEY